MIISNLFTGTLCQYQAVPKFRQQYLETAGMNLDANLILPTNLDPQLQVNFLEGRDFEEIPKTSSFNQLSKAIVDGSWIACFRMTWVSGVN